MLVTPTKKETQETYSVNVVLQNSRDGFSMLNVLLCDQGQVGDLVSVVGHKVFQRTLVVFGDLI
jgi:hypothetical protein